MTSDNSGNGDQKYGKGNDAFRSKMSAVAHANAIEREVESIVFGDVSDTADEKLINGAKELLESLNPELKNRLGIVPDTGLKW